MKLYEFLQAGLQTVDIYQALILNENAPNILLGGNFDMLPSYTPSDADGEIRKSFLRKIMGRYYNYELFTPDALYFENRMFWRLNQIMPTYAAKFNATVTPEEFAAVFKSSVSTNVTRDKTGVDTGSSSATGGSTNRRDNTIDTEDHSTNSGDSTNFESDYPQVIVGGATDYNTAGSKQSNTGKTDSTGKVVENGGNTYTQDLHTSRNSQNIENAIEQRTRDLTPYELMLAKEKIMRVVMNIEEEIVLAVSQMFKNIGWDLDDCEFEENIDRAFREMILLTLELQRLSERVNILDFTPEQLASLQLIPGIRSDLDQAKLDIIAIQEDLATIGDAYLPEVTVADAGKLLMVNGAGKWDAILLPNWALEGY